MEYTDLYSLREGFNREGILICFAGPFSHSIIEDLGGAVKKYLEAAQLPKASLMDVFSVFIEQAQNVRNYGRDKAQAGHLDRDFSSGIVIIAQQDGRHCVSSGNIVERGDIQGAVDRLEQLRPLDKQALKAAYKEQLRKSPAGGAGGGLGLIDMSRKAAQPLEYAIRDVDDRYCFFSLKATL